MAAAIDIPKFNTPMKTSRIHEKASSWIFPVVQEEHLVQEWCVLHRLIDELSSIQQRLGTPLEREGDYDHVREVGHNIRNKLQLLQLWKDHCTVGNTETESDEIRFTC